MTNRFKAFLRSVRATFAEQSEAIDAKPAFPGGGHTFSFTGYGSTYRERRYTAEEERQRSAIFKKERLLDRLIKSVHIVVDAYVNQPILQKQLDQLCQDEFYPWVSAESSHNHTIMNELMII